MTPFTPASTAPTRRPGPAVFFALIPLPISERKKLRAPTSGTAILAIVLAVTVFILMVGATVVNYVLAASGIYV